MTDIYAAYWQGNSVPPQPAGGVTGKTNRAPGDFLAVTVGPYSAAWSHQIWITKPYTKLLFDWGEARSGATADLGVIAAGAEVEFRVLARDGSTLKTDQYSTGPGFKTYTHDDSDAISQGSWLLGLEDQYGLPGTDMDYNDMLLYVNNAGTGGVKRWNGSSWTNLTHGLGDVIRALPSVRGGVSRWFVTDMYFIDNKLWVTWWDDYRRLSGTAIYSGSTWKINYSNDLMASSPSSRYVYTGFVCWKGQAHVYGFNYVTSRFAIFKVQGTTLIKVAEDTGAWNFYHAFRNCVVPNPANPNELVVGDGHNDRFAYLDMVTKQFTQGSSPGGSCVFCLGVDNQKRLWAGDYGSITYWSADGHTWSTSMTGTHIPEMWEMRRWKNQLYGVGCAPCMIVKRTDLAAGTASPDALWEVVHHATSLPDSDGMGFMSVQETPEGLYLGFGGEPYYYNKTVRNFNTRATVYYWNGTTLADIGRNEDWGDGVICVISNARSCRPGLLTGAPDWGGVHMDPKADLVPRGLAGR